MDELETKRRSTPPSDADVVQVLMRAARPKPDAPATAALLEYVRLFAWPDGLSLDHDFPYTRSLATALSAG